MKTSTSRQHPAVRALAAATAGVAMLLFATAGGAHGSGTFDPYRVDYTGPQLISFVDTDAAPVHCVGLAADTGSYLLMLGGLVAPITACSAYSADRQQCKIVAPISAGVGQLVAAVAAFVGADELLGHEFRHCRDHDFHPAVLPFAERAQ